MNPLAPPSTAAAKALIPEVHPDANPSHSPTPSSQPVSGLLDSILAATGDAGDTSNRLERFLREDDLGSALCDWLERIPLFKGAALRKYIAGRLNRDIARLDLLLNRQLNAILHHHDFQKLEASWRSLRSLVEQVPEGSNIRIKVLNVSWKELTKDLTVRALEFDQSDLFRKVYSDEFGMPGGEAYGVLLGDYEIRHRMTADHPYDDIETLDRIAGVAAAAFAPFISSVHPSLFDLESFAQLEKPLNLPQTFERLDYLKWRAFRRKEDARFIGLTLPRVMVRVPYADDSARVDGFRFREEPVTEGRSNYLWGNAAYAFVGVLIRAFAETGWLADIRGVRRGELSAGVVAGLPVHWFRTDKRGVAPLCSTETIITDAQEKELGELGFIPLCYCQDSEWSAFYGNQSAQKPKDYDETSAAVNARMSAMLQYIFCASRFAHYLKAIVRDWTGSFTGPGDVQEKLSRWLRDYTSAGESSDAESRAKHPLREARVEVEESSERPGSYSCQIFLRPHYQLDQLFAALNLQSTLAPGKK